MNVAVIPTFRFVLGYEVHITRAEFWADNVGHRISASEWQRLVDNDPQMRIDDANGKHHAIWDGHPNYNEAWLIWQDGNISTKHPDTQLLGKMVEIASQLDARIQGDDGEIYLPNETEREIVEGFWSNTPLAALLLSLIAVVMLWIAFSLDANVRQTHPVGTPMPIQWAVTLAGLGCFGILSWLVSILFSTVSIILRMKSLRIATLAMTINCIIGFYLIPR